MNRVIALAMGCAFLSFLPRVAAAQSGQPTPNQKNNCTAQNWSDHDRVNYAESRE